MKSIFFAVSFVFFLFPAPPIARADLTIVQKVEGLGEPSEMTIKIKADKVRIDASPKVTTIFDRTTGEMTNLMNDEKTVVRLSADKVKAAAEMINKFSPQKEGAEKPKLVSTGRKEMVNGYETEQYVYDGPDFKATYWIALKYPNAAEILKQLQTLKSDAWSGTNVGMPDYRDFPGLPLRTRMIMGKAGGTEQGQEFTSTLISVKTNPLNDSEFAVPPDFKEVEIPDIFGGKQMAPSSRSVPQK